jgi:hypothetical protein
VTGEELLRRVGQMPPSRNRDRLGDRSDQPTGQEPRKRRQVPFIGPFPDEATIGRVNRDPYGRRSYRGGCGTVRTATVKVRVL